VTIGAALFGALAGTAQSRGVSPYLPLNLEPEMERQIEQVLTLADKPFLTRPIAAAVVWDALPAACARDQALCRSVERYLKRYMNRVGIAEASISGAATGGASRTVPNRHGLLTDSGWEASARVYWQPFDHALLTLGAVAYEGGIYDGDVTPTGSLLSLGWSFAQLDMGFRDHWLSPFSDSAMLLATEAPTMPSVTISNYIPLTRLDIHYEVFAAQMSESDDIVFEEGLTSGNPNIAGLHLSIEPVSGWSLGFNRIMQFGGGDRDDYSFGDVVDAFFNPSSHDNASDPGESEFGNQVAAITSRFVFPGAVPFSVYAEYAGEDTSRGRNYLLGNSALSVGIDFPLLWERFDLTLELSEWQNSWYVHHIYGDGLTNEGRVIGHWGADQRVVNDGVGAHSAMARFGWRPPFGGSFALRGRVIENESYSATAYERGYDLALSYARPVGAFSLGGEIYAGRDVFGEDFSRIAAFVRYAPQGGAGRAHPMLPAEPGQRERASGADLFVDLGANANQVRIDLDDDLPRTTTDSEAGMHLGIGARRQVSERQDLGVRVEYDDIGGHALIGVRALDYRYRFAGPLALTGFVGAARYDLATPAYGLYIGAGMQWRGVLRSNFDLSLDLRYASKVARDDLVDGDPVGGRPDSFYDIASAALYLSYRY
jgi:hypothetical protein